MGKENLRPMGSVDNSGGIRTSVQTVATSVGVSHSLFSLFGSLKTSTSVRGSVCSSSTVLSSRALNPVFSGLGSLYSSPGISSSQSDPIHRRFPSGMGSLSGRSNCFRDVVFHLSERSHQSFGNEGSSVSSFSSFSFQTLSGVPIYCLGNRQHNSGSLPEESGRNTLLLSVSAGQGCSDPMLSIPDSSGCETYSRPSERSCGLSFQVLSTSQYRVGTSSGSLSIYSSSLGKSQYRSIRNESELQDDNFRLPSSRPQSLCCGRNECILGGNVRLCIPPIQISCPCSSQDNRREMQDHSYCSSLAKTSLVCKSTASVLGQAISASLKMKSSISVQRGCSSSFFRKTPSTRLVSVRDNLRQKGFSETATKHISRSVRESTSIVYDAKWTIFSDRCVGREIDPFKISVQQLADFLVFLFEVKGTDLLSLELFIFLVVGQRRNLKSRLFKELNQPIDYTPKYTFKR